MRIDLDDLAPGLKDYPNVPKTIGAVLSCRVATYHELQSVYSLEDVYDMLEVVAVDAQNRTIIARHANREANA